MQTTGVEFLNTVKDHKHEEEMSLRPPSFADFVGQSRTIERLKIMVGAAKKRNDALDHILFSGPPGLGKTSLAFILGHELNRSVKITSGPAVEKASDLAGLLTSLEAGDILFIDEIHRLSKPVEEFLYSAMEDYRIDIMIDQGPNARSVRLSLPKFTLIGATTRVGLLSAPPRSRFTLQTRLEHYQASDLSTIVLRSSRIMHASINQEGAMEIASRARGTPRIANNLLKFVRDYALERSRDGVITQKMAKNALELLDIDQTGLDTMDKRILKTISEQFNGGPVGLKTVAIAIGEEPDTLEEVHEPYLIQEGYIQRTPQGRILTPKAFDYIRFIE